MPDELVSNDGSLLPMDQSIVLVVHWYCPVYMERCADHWLALVAPSLAEVIGRGLQHQQMPVQETPFNDIGIQFCLVWFEKLNFVRKVRMMLQTFCNKVFHKDKSKHRQRCRTIPFALRPESEFYVFSGTLASLTGHHKLQASEMINKINVLKNFKRKNGNTLTQTPNFGIPSLIGFRGQRSHSTPACSIFLVAQPRVV